MLCTQVKFRTTSPNIFKSNAVRKVYFLNPSLCVYTYTFYSFYTLLQTKRARFDLACAGRTYMFALGMEDMGTNTVQEFMCFHIDQLTVQGVGPLKCKYSEPFSSNVTTVIDLTYCMCKNTKSYSISYR